MIPEIISVVSCGETRIDLRAFLLKADIRYVQEKKQELQTFLESGLGHGKKRRSPSIDPGQPFRLEVSTSQKVTFHLLAQSVNEPSNPEGTMLSPGGYHQN